MKIIHSVKEMQAFRKTMGNNVGFVPTMGALHDGHASLLRASVKENAATVLSIFVNPTQFTNPDDLAKYPKTWEADLELARKNDVSVIFSPDFKDLYPDNYSYKVSESNFSGELCGAHRPGHFDGVLSVVMKLFNIVKPNRAYFGEKDFQQLLLIEGMVNAFFMDLEIVRCPTVREITGLAMSSRNTRLSSNEKSQAPQIHEILISSKSPEEAHSRLSEAGFNVDYVEDKFERRFVAATLGNVRLIDNVGL